MKVSRWEEKFFNVLFDPIKECVEERKIESKLNYFYRRLVTQDLVVAERIGDVEDNYQLLLFLVCILIHLSIAPKEKTSIKFIL